MNYRRRINRTLLNYSYRTLMNYSYRTLMNYRRINRTMNYRRRTMVSRSTSSTSVSTSWCYPIIYTHAPTCKEY
jgi:hypothetical protein